jgi:hypothetical protein
MAEDESSLNRRFFVHLTVMAYVAPLYEGAEGGK